MSPLNKTLAVALVVAALLCAYVYAGYRDLVERDDKVYILEMDSGRVWAIDTALRRVAPWESAFNTLTPWGTPPLSIPNGTDAVLVGDVVVANVQIGCKRLLSEQVACTTFRPPESAPDVIVDYEKYTWPQQTTPFTKVVDAVRSKVQKPSDDLPRVLSVRAVIIYRPDEKNGPWRLETTGPAVAFQGRGAHYFARIVGITAPSISEFYER